MRWDDRIGRRLRLKDLHTLQTIAEAGSMAKASAQLSLSQPAISKAIADMEHVLGTPVLDRSSRGVELTACGRLLLERGRSIFDDLRQCMGEIEELSDPTRGEIRIGTTEPISIFVSEAIVRLARQYPRITYRVEVSDTATLLRLLRERNLDVVVTRWTSTSIADDLVAKVLYKSVLGVMANRHHPLLRRKRLELSDLMNERWTLSPADSFLGRLVGDVFRRRKLELPRAIVTTISVYMRLNLLAGAEFLTILPIGMEQHRSNRAWLRALDVDLSDSSGPIAGITLRKRHMAGATKLFLKSCSDALPKLPRISEAA
jgi:DNA-binding transcriptional LysR family regulator